MDLGQWWETDRAAYEAKQHRAHPEFQRIGVLQGASNQRPDRNIGIANEGGADQYRGVADRPAPEVSHAVGDAPNTAVLTSAERYSYDNELRRIENRLKEIENGAFHHPLDGVCYDDKQKAERKKLKPRAEQLKKWLGYLA